jgi:hypothetical protein
MTVTELLWTETAIILDDHSSTKIKCSPQRSMLPSASLQCSSSRNFVPWVFSMTKCRESIASFKVAIWSLLAISFLCSCFDIALGQTDQATPSNVSPPSLNAPSVTIHNGQITAKVYLSDNRNGDFYRSTRFDQTGIVGQLALGREKIYGGAWFDLVSPEIHDVSVTPARIIVNPNTAIMGPVEEYDPVGFDDASSGGTFLKIGVGLLRRPDDKSYDHTRYYDIVDAGKRATRVVQNAVTFVQDVGEAGNAEYAYHYEKTLRLVPGKPQMIIDHVLTNTGAKAIQTTVYDHNFLSLSAGNDNVAITLPFAPIPNRPIQNELARIDGNSILYGKPLVDEDRVSFPITGFGNDVRDYDIRVENTVTGVGMRVTADQPLVRLNLWSIRSVLGIEPYIGINLPSGASKRWSYTYDFVAPKRKPMRTK